MQDGTLARSGFGQTDGDYAPILKFTEEFNNIPYRRFDSYVLHRVNLFALPENYDFEALEAALSKILAALPAIKRIFARPISRLKDNSVILPAESVQVINNQTIIHASAHSELWEDITPEGLKPRKLLTLNHIDTYSIYENIAFTKAVNTILSFVGRNMRILRDMLYAHRDMKLNLLERENHLSYFLALGKLHIGYVRDYDKHRQTAINCLDKLIFIDRVIRARINCPLYRQCDRQSQKPITLKKTNIFRSHKDYRKIYLLLKWFAETDTDTELEVCGASSGSHESYRVYCTLLSLFAAGHFNFSFDEEKNIDFTAPDVEAVFGEWKLKLEQLECGKSAALRFTLTKDRAYRIVLLPTHGAENDKETLSLLRERGEAEEYLAADPLEGGNGRVHISLFDLDSFRRIQQLLLRGMILSDEKRDTCPFCGQPLEREENAQGEAHHCPACRTQITTLTCPESGKPYTVTKIKNFRPDDGADLTVKRDKLLYNRYVETRMHFRNITPITPHLELICPHCGMTHTQR